MNRIKILHFDEGFWLYYFRLENSKLKWLLMGYEVRTKSKFKQETDFKANIAISP